MYNKNWQLDKKTAPQIFRARNVNVYYKLALTLFHKYSFLNSPTQLLYWKLLFKASTKQVGWMGSSSLGRFKKVRKKVGQVITPLLNLSSPNLAAKSKQYTTMWSHFLQYWNQIRPKSNAVYVVHRDFRIMFFSGACPYSGQDLVSPRRVYMRWVESYNLLFNLFYINSNVQITTNRFFIEEALVFNWQSSYKNHKAFKFLQPIFTFCDVFHGGYIHYALRFIKRQKIDWILVVDLKHHFNLVRYFQRIGLYSVGLIPINYSPWSVSYPVPSFSDSKVSQFYFLKWVFYIKVRATSTYYANLLDMRY